MDTSTRKAKAFRYYCMGLTAREIGKLLDISHRTVQAYKQADNWQAKRSPSLLKQRALEMYQNGLSYQEIASLLQVSKSTVYNYLSEARKIGVDA